MLNVAGATYGLYKHIIIGSDGALLWASVIMFFFGVGKYVEKALALWRGDLGSIRSSIKKPSSGFTERVGLARGRKLDNERALLVAHGLFHISKGAFVDYSVKDLVKESDINIEVFSYGWKEMCKVVEMELSLMYDILYTKAAVVHTWFGYGIRITSPLATAVALLLFCLYNKDSQRRGDVAITYILLVATFLLDLIWLLTALGSTWTYAFLNDRPGSWLHHQLLSTGRWHRFRRFILSLDPCQLFAKEPTSYRLWSGYIGQYNLLQEYCTHDTTSQWRELAKKVGLEDRWMEYQYHYSNVREMLFERIWNLLKSAYPPKEDQEKPRKEPKPDKEGIVRRHRELEEDLNFDPDFQEDILIWHIATDVFLLSSDQNAASSDYVQAIKALSDYMVFLVAVRPNMLPGLKLRSTYEATRDALDKIWHEEASSSSSKKEKKQLAIILRDLEKRPWPGSKQRKPHNRRLLGNASFLYDSEGNRRRTRPSPLFEKSVILSDGTMHAEELLKFADSGGLKFSEEIVRFLPELQQGFPRHLQCTNRCSNLEQFGRIDMQELLELIFKAWVRMLICASIRCSRDSHAKQLSRGGELTTIVWILVEHASILRIRSDTSSDETDMNACSVM